MHKGSSTYLKDFSKLKLPDIRTVFKLLDIKSKIDIEQHFDIKTFLKLPDITKMKKTVINKVFDIKNTLISGNFKKMISSVQEP